MWIWFLVIGGLRTHVFGGVFVVCSCAWLCGVKMCGLIRLRLGC